ncbi:MAG: hypothetical protein EKK56_00920 [Flavobacteriaceae bacterium]|nr:MAG: hypothetical protein EKK56_00920 [Flavobacteriaceae bacterium]
MSVTPMSINNFDPNSLVSNPQRPLGGIVDSGTVTFDVDYGEYARWIYVGTTGNISYVKYDGTTQTLPNIAAGIWHPICSVRINSSGTSIAANQIFWGS